MTQCYYIEVFEMRIKLTILHNKIACDINSHI